MDSQLRDDVHDDEFPELTTIDLDSYFKEQIAYFYVNLTRKDFIEDVLELSKKLDVVLRFLKQQIRHNSSFVKYLELFYKMLAQTRDISNGKGEHCISYMMILAFYEVFPSLAIYAVHRFCKPIGDIDALGSWRDIKYLCEHIRLYSNKRENHELINICIQLMNSQLKTDLESWKFSINAGSRNHISNVAKWIPREKKKFDWLFNRLVINWIKTNKSYMFSNTDDSWIAAISKAKRIYRKKVAFLNKILDTTEIKLCSQNKNEIDPKNIYCYTSMKNRALLASGSDGPVINSRHNHYPIAFFIKEAIRLTNKIAYCSECGRDREIETLNKQWEWFSKSIPNYEFENILPILDISENMQKNDAYAFYSAIGYAIIIAERSSWGKRILAVDHKPIWINLESNIPFVDTVENISNIIKSNSNTNSNMETAMELLILSFIETKSTPRFIKNITLVLLSNNVNALSQCKDAFINYGYNLPRFIIWNIEKYNIRELPYDINDKCCVFSGMSNGVLKSLSALLWHIKTKNMSLFENISFILNNPKYDIFGDYLKELINKFP